MPGRVEEEETDNETMYLFSPVWVLQYLENTVQHLETKNILNQKGSVHTRTDKHQCRLKMVCIIDAIRF